MTTTITHYEIVKNALAHLGDKWQNPPHYSILAAHAGMDAHHFHKVFTRWVGLSPKRYTDTLIQHSAHQDLQQGASLEEVSFTHGLSAPSRLHDLCIRHVALSPGEIKARAKGIEFVWGTSQTPFGHALSLSSLRGLSAYAFFDAGQEDSAFNDLHARFPHANYQRDDTQSQAVSDIIFSGGILPLALYGTPFQLQVWKALLEVKPAQISTYSAIATHISRPKAVRAVGAAIGANPISWVIPCHRILSADRRLTGYHWGIDRKRTMLSFEHARAFASSDI